MQTKTALFVVILAGCCLSTGQSATNAPTLAPVDLQFFGDVYMPEHVVAVTQSTSDDPRIFGPIRPLLASARINIVNFEGVATSAFIPYTKKDYTLRMVLNAAAILKSAGIHGVTLANNHAMDFGFQGLFDTLVTLEQAGIRIAGAGNKIAEAVRPMVFSSPQGNVCILAISRTFPAKFWATSDRPGTATADYTQLAALVRDYASTGCFTLLVAHWGSELSTEVQTYQRDLGHLAINSGAMAVIGHHPHILQEIEIYKRRPIFYSIGNFAFGTLPIHSGQEGLAVRITLPKVPGHPAKTEAVALRVDNGTVFYRPRLFRPDEDSPIARIKNPAWECQGKAAGNERKKGKHWLCLP